MTRITLTVAVPEAHKDDATHLAVALGWIEGWRPDEWEQTFTPQMQDANGNLYRVMSCPVGESFVIRAATNEPVQRPPEDTEPYLVDLDAAHRAQGILTIWQPDVTPTPPQVDTSTIIAVVGIKGTEALEQIGLTNLPMEEMP